MPLVSMKNLLEKARREHYGIGAFNIFNVESMEALIEIAEEKRSPVIIAYYEGLKENMNIETIAVVGKKLAENAKVPVVLHLDHGQSYEYCITALRNGFSSIMIDASIYPLEENIAITKKAVGACRHLGVTVEAELGHVGTGSTYGAENDDSYKTIPEEVERFIQETDVDALAVSIGNAHGAYRSEPKIDHERMIQLNQVSSIPLVLHGGSGISDNDFRQLVKEGICKINIGTEFMTGASKAIIDSINEGKESILDFCLASKEGAKKVAAIRMDVFGSSGKA